MSINKNELLTLVREHYVESSDFNGLSVDVLDSDDPALANMVIDLIQEGELDLVRGDGHPNPHIKALSVNSIDEQIRKILDQGLEGNLYPTPRHLREHDAGGKEDAPFTKELELGEPQLEHRAFDLRILEWYRNDPRYSYDVDNIHGQIHKQSATEAPGGAIVRDHLQFLEFGFAYNDSGERAIAIFLRYLHNLPAEQQRHLKDHQLTSDYKLHPDFFRTQIIGDFPERVSIYDAFLEEKKIVNDMCGLIGGARLFKTNNRAYERPSGFHILIRPTSKEYRDFALLLDQLLSDDLNREFFKGDIQTSEVLTRQDGTTVTQPIGTITLLERWLRKHFRPHEPKGMDDLFKDLRAVRSERQRPAHVADDNTFDQAFVKAQRELIVKAFNVVRTIRMVLENHPAVAGYEVPDWLREGKVWTM